MSSPLVREEILVSTRIYKDRMASGLGSRKEMGVYWWIIGRVWENNNTGEIAVIVNGGDGNRQVSFSRYKIATHKKNIIIAQENLPLSLILLLRVFVRYNIWLESSSLRSWNY